jgi:hypothetical protein
MPPIASEDQWLVATPQSVSSTLPVICQINTPMIVHSAAAREESAAAAITTTIADQCLLSR